MYKGDLATSLSYVTEDKEENSTSFDMIVNEYTSFE